MDPSPEQLDRMRALVRAAMNEGAMGVGSSLIYAPAFFAETPELIALARERFPDQDWILGGAAFTFFGP